MMMKTLATGMLWLMLLSGCQSNLPDTAAPAPDSAIAAKTDRQTTTMPTQNTLKSKQMPTNMAINTATDAAVTTPITPALLAAYHWTLSSANDRQQQPLPALMQVEQPARLHFEHSGGQHNGSQHNDGQNIINFGVGCNGMGGTYTLDENVLATEDLMSTMIMCSEDLNQAEAALSKAMQGRSVLSLKIDDAVNGVNDTAQLTQQTANGDILLWQGSKTPEAKYGQTPTIVFWEIKAQQPKCPDATMTSCLSVRPVYYDAQGIKTGVGDWQLFVEGIAGYTHDNSVNRIVRLKRFVVNPVAVKGKQFVYVLDRVIESSTVD